MTWAALAAAFSPVLFDLTQNLAEHPGDRVTLFSPLLLVLALRDGNRAADIPRRDGGIGIAIGIALELLGIATDSWSIARLGLPVGALGIARWAGWPPIVVIGLLFFAIPVPDTIVLLPSPALETAVAEAAGAILRAFGAPLTVHGASFVTSSGRILLDPIDGGRNLAVALAEMGWYATAREGGGIRRAAVRASALCLLALPLQTLAAVVAGGLLGAGWRSAGIFALKQGGWLLVGAAGLFWIHFRSIGAPGLLDDPPPDRGSRHS